MNLNKPVARIVVSTLAAALLVALSMAPVAGVSGAAMASANNSMQSNLDDMTSGWTPGVTTVEDRNGAPIAWLYSQRRFPVASDHIAKSTKDALVAAEDRRFYEHGGVDLQGALRALGTNLVAGGVEQGASTIDQQYVKNYMLLVDADTKAKQKAATEQSITRKLREMRMATKLDQTLSKDEILTRYLNLVPFGNQSFGIQSAAQTYFGIDAKDLSVPQSAMLAGMVQSSEFLNPYKNPQGTTERRNTVLQTMVSSGYLSQQDADRYSAEPLGVLPQPKGLPNGCLAAGDKGFFCDYITQYLEDHGISSDDVKRNGYTIKTTLDPQVHDAAKAAIDSNVSPDTRGAAGVMDVVEPGPDSRNILAMVSSRRYGLDANNHETYLAQTSSTEGSGAGSVFKVFTAATALEQGMGLSNSLPVPARFETPGMGSGGAPNCPENTYCVENDGPMKSPMTMQEALANSPNTTFVMLMKKLGVGNVVDMSVRLGMRSYAKAGSYDSKQSIADHFKSANLGSFTLGPSAVNPLELSNVGATLASHGRWCEPNPIGTITDQSGKEVYIERPACDQALDPGMADALASGMTQDVKSGTASAAARSSNFTGQLASKTGTTETSQSAAFLGYNSNVAAAPYIFNDGDSLSSLCTGPVRQCPLGNLYGGNEPARSFFQMATRVPSAMQGVIPPMPPQFRYGTNPASGLY